MKLDVNALRYLAKEDFRVLTAVELGMRNHEIVPAELVERIAHLKHGGCYGVLKNLLKYKLVHHDSSKYDGFRLTYLGYDFLAIKTFVNRGVFSGVGRQIGVGKESDIFEVITEDGTILVMKLHRLGRISFRAVKSKRDYLRHRRSYNWLYLSRLAAIKEFAFMKALGEHGFPVPTAIECNRHCVVMSLIQGYPLVQVKQLQNPDDVFETIIGLIVRLAEHGLIHCDFNEFNIMIDDNEKITMIDFPQMVSVSHRNAKMFFDRDIECVFKFFRKRFNLSYEEDWEQDELSRSDADEEGGRLCFSSIEKSAGFLDKELAASGFTRKDQENIQKYIEGENEDSDDDDDDDGEDDDDDDGEDDDDDDGEDDVNDEGDEPSAYELVGVPVSSLKMADEPEGSSGFTEVGDKESWVPGEGEDGDNLSDASECSENDEKLAKRLNKERKRAIASACGQRKPVSSRNSYKDKGRKSSLNSKVQRQALKW